MRKDYKMLAISLFGMVLALISCGATSTFGQAQTLGNVGGNAEATASSNNTEAPRVIRHGDTIQRRVFLRDRNVWNIARQGEGKSQSLSDKGSSRAKISKEKIAKDKAAAYSKSRPIVNSSKETTEEFKGDPTVQRIVVGHGEVKQNASNRLQRPDDAPINKNETSSKGKLSFPTPVEPNGNHRLLPVKPETKRNAFPGSYSQWDNAFDSAWIAEEKERHEIKPIADNRAVVNIKGSQKDGHTYGNYTAADLLLWEKETERLVVEGSFIFHNADALGSTNGTSCDMCHPDAEGTHAETYPKYQVQLGRVALLRDMANWCLQNPCRGEPMSGDDARMRALEAYMQAQRSGKLMKYGKH